MQFPESWLREFCDPPLSTQQLADTLTMAGMEVEDLRAVAPPFSGVVVGEILSITKHPQADRLNVCQVDVGVDAPLSIVCGAPNARAGIKVPCARVGALLPPAQEGQAPFAIKLSALRGVDSHGMLCSARELKLSDEAGGLLILPPDAVPGVDLRRQLQLDDTLFTLKLTPNLGHCLSVQGVAREVAALTGAPLRVPAPQPVVARHDDRLPVRIEASDLCGRFTGRIIRNINLSAPTPAWLVERLARCGQRSVNALVDISNYVMFESGQPSHIFDLGKVHGGLTVRWARPGETLKLLNSNTVELDAAVGVIADEQGVESLAGIMGGDATAVSDATRDVYIEAAFWWPQAVAGRARRYQFSTDASHRFERGVDPAATVSAIERITRLIVDICGGEPSVVDDHVVNLPKPPAVTLRVARAAKVIGMPLTQAQCLGVLQRLGLSVSEGQGTLSVTPPTWRFDLQIEEDLIEEIIRVLGYHTLPASAPLAPVSARLRRESQRSLYAVRRQLAALDYQETINFSFVEERLERELAGNAQPIRLLNPIAAPLAVMRSSLAGSLLNVLRFNLAHRAARVRVFEVGRVFMRDAGVADTLASVAGIAQPLRVGGLVYGSVDGVQWGSPERAADFFDVKGDVEALLTPRTARFVPFEHAALHPGRAAQVEVDGRAIGFVGELHPQWRLAYELPHAPLLFELDARALTEYPVVQCQPIARQQSVWRDLAVLAGDHVTHDALIDAVITTHPALIHSAVLFDVYRPAGGGPRSLAVRIELRDDAATLTDERIDGVMDEVLTRLGTRLGVRLRAS